MNLHRVYKTKTSLCLLSCQSNGRINLNFWYLSWKVCSLNCFSAHSFIFIATILCLQSVFEVCIFSTHWHGKILSVLTFCRFSVDVNIFKRLVILLLSGHKKLCRAWSKMTCLQKCQFGFMLDFNFANSFFSAVIIRLNFL